MNVTLRTPLMTREQFFGWAEAQDSRYEFDSVRPVAMTGGTLGHSQIMLNIQSALRLRLKGGPCQPLGPDAGVATMGEAVRYPDALITCTKFAADDHLAPGVVAVFEVLSKTSGRIDRIDKVREYQAVPSILRYIVVERISIAATIFERSAGHDLWTARTVTSGDIVHIPEAGIEIPLDDFYEGTGLTGTAQPATDD